LRLGLNYATEPSGETLAVIIQTLSMDKTKRKEILNQLAEKELAEFRKGLPFDENIFPKLFDFLDIELDKKGCNHTTILTKIFLDKNKVSNEAEVIEWLADNGGYCDCEVLANVEDLFDYLKPPVVKSLKTSQIRKQKLNNLKTDFGFSIEKIPSPWILTETISGNDRSYNFQFGKSNSCIVNLISDFPLAQLENDKFWTDLWIKETELDYNLDDLTVERIEFGNYLAVFVKNKNWTPVKIWCINKSTKKWFLKMTTELSRYKGDFKELEKLLINIKTE
jgi:hypothetical protein